MSTDRISKEQRTKNMKAVRNSGSKIETRMQKALWHKGYHYRKNYTQIPGKPDIVFTKLKIAIFCDSEFWHGFDWENKKHDFKSEKEFWWKKIERNIERDKEVNQLLSDLGWTVLRFWGKEITNNTDKCLQIIEETFEIRKAEHNTKKRL